MATIQITSPTGTFSGTDVDDRFVYVPTSLTSFTGTIAGGEGIDTVAVGNGTVPLNVGGVPIAPVNVAGTISGVERIAFDSAAGTAITLSILLDRIAGVFSIEGGVGRDLLTLAVPTVGIYTLPNLTFMNWTSAAPNDISNPLADSVTLSTALPGSTLVARDDIAVTQTLQSSAQHTVTLTGGKGDDRLVLSGPSGIPQVDNARAFGNGGDDVIVLTARANLPNPVSAILQRDYNFMAVDGGTGMDTLLVQGPVQLHGSLTGVEVLAFSPYTFTTFLNGQSNAVSSPGQLTTVSRTLGNAPSFQLAGTGALTVDLSDNRFSGSNLTFATNAQVAITINGTTTADTVTGSARADTINGNNGADILRGMVGKDTLFGGAGKDVLNGGAGQDSLTGGADADIFRFLAVSDSAAGIATRDTITDFSHAQGDKFDLHALDANWKLAGNQDFFLGGSAFTRKAGEITQVRVGSDIVLRADVNGDAVADFALLLKGLTAPLVADDFLL